MGKKTHPKDWKPFCWQENISPRFAYLRFFVATSISKAGVFRKNSPKPTSPKFLRTFLLLINPWKSNQHLKHGASFWMVKPYYKKNGGL